MEEDIVVFTQRFFKDMGSTNRINLIDADDYAEIAAHVSTSDSFDFGQYDLCGPQNLSAEDMISAFRQISSKEVIMRYFPDDAFIEMSRRNGMPETKIDTLIQMFRSYNEHGFKGNPFVATAILGRKPIDIQALLKASLQ